MSDKIGIGIGIVGCLFVLACDSGSSGPGEDAGSWQDAEIVAELDAGVTDAQAAPDCQAEAPLTCDQPSPRYEDVGPIFASRCVTCHNGAGEEWPLTSYQHVADWFGEIRAQMLACTMPPLDSGLSMPLEERQLILRWIRCGFPR